VNSHQLFIPFGLRREVDESSKALSVILWSDIQSWGVANSFVGDGVGGFPSSSTLSMPLASNQKAVLTGGYIPEDN